MQSEMFQKARANTTVNTPILQSNFNFVHMIWFCDEKAIWSDAEKF